MSSFQGKSRFYEIFSRQKSLFVLLAKEKDACRSAYVVRTRKFYSFYVRAAIDREVPGLDYEIPETKPCTRLLLYLSLAGFACGFSLLNPSVAYAGEDDENSVCANSGRHKGRFASKRRLSVLKNLVRASEKKSQEKQIDTEEEDIEPPRKTVTRSKQQNIEEEDAQMLSGTRTVNMEVLKNDLKSCLHCQAECMPGIAVSYDMGWTKRGKGHNSLTGHGASMGLKTGKVLSYATRCKACRVCESSKKSGKVAKTHDCRKNHVGSSKSMERDVAVELWTNALDSGTHFSTYVGDDDSTTIADILSKVPYKVEKWSDTIHTKRSLTTVFTI
ncbi:uncharacterized protein [Montipora capricornis]|uniref:uncharacterized protein n=1 Tax=Montipora capricornis TaxID=246305 RepID=UPI0035F19F82